MRERSIKRISSSNKLRKGGGEITRGREDGAQRIEIEGTQERRLGKNWKGGRDTCWKNIQAGQGRTKDSPINV